MNENVYRSQLKCVMLDTGKYIASYPCLVVYFTKIFLRMPWFDNFCRGLIREGHSLMAIDSEENELVGLSLTHQCRRKLYNYLHYA